MITQNTANTILNAFFGKAGNINLAYSCYIGLSTTQPSATGENFTEPEASTGYARTFLGTVNQQQTQMMDAASEGTISNGTNIIFFPEATATWGTISYFGIFTSKSDGKPIMWGALTTPISVPSGYIPIFRAGALNVSLQ